MVRRIGIDRAPTLELLEQRCLLSADLFSVYDGPTLVEVFHGHGCACGCCGPYVSETGEDAYIYRTYQQPAASESGGDDGSGIETGGTVTSSLGTFNIVLIAGSGLSANSAAMAAFERAAMAWEAFISDPITITINANMTDMGNPNVIGSTGTVALQASHNTIRDFLVADASGEPDDSITAFLPTAAQVSWTLPSGFTTSSSVAGSKANLKAMGFTGLDASFGVSDATITFNTQFSFDYDNSNGVSAGTMDFETVAIHEIGHALGFISSVDIVDHYLNLGQTSTITPYALDLYRFRDGNATVDPGNTSQFTSTPRNLETSITPIFDQISTWNGLAAEIQFARGYHTGDGRQASHWKDNLTIGVMDPTLSLGELVPISLADLRALDVIGYDVVITVNTPPVANNDTAAIGEDSLLSVAAPGVLANDTDADGHTLTVTGYQATSAMGAIVVVNANGSYTYDPRNAASLQALNDGQQAQDTFTYTISDGNGGTSNATVTVTVTGADEAGGAYTAIVDNTDAAFSTTGTWLTHASGYQGSIRYVAPDAGTAGDIASWSFTGLAAGTYEVYATWTTNSKRATNATYTLLNGASPVGSASVNQRLAPNDLTASGAAWELLGTVTVTGSSLNVNLSGLGNGSVVADAIRIASTVAVPSLTVSVNPASISENGGAATGTVTRTGDLSQALVVNLLSNDTSEATVPATVQINAGQASANFAVTAVDDALVDGTQSVTVSASASGYAPGQTAISVTDDDTPAETYTAIVDNTDAAFSTTGTWLTHASGYQGSIRYVAPDAGTAGDVASWSFTGLAAGTYEVYATWTTNSKRATNAAYTLLNGASPVGSASVNQRLAPNDLTGSGAAWELLGTVTVTGSSLNVSLSGLGNGSVVADAIRIASTVAVPSLTVSVNPASISENGGAATGTVTRTGDLSQALVVNLLSNDTSEATVPATVQINAGQASANFAVTAVDDALVDGTQSVTVSASASGYAPGQTAISVTDDDTPAETYTAIVDNTDAAFSTTGTWLTHASGYQGSLRYVAPDAGTAGDVASWSFTGLAAGTYEVYATWTTNSKRATNATYTLLNGASPVGSASVNQRLAPNDLTASGAAWELLGTVTVTVTGSSLNVSLSGLGNGSIVADAIRIASVTSLESGVAASPIPTGTFAPADRGPGALPAASIPSSVWAHLFDRIDLDNGRSRRAVEALGRVIDILAVDEN